MSGELTTWRPQSDLRAMVPGQYAFTLDPKIKRNQELLAAACRDKPPSIKKAANLEIVVTDLVYYTFDKSDEQTGEVRRLPRLVVIGPKGEMYSMSGWKAIEDVLFPCTVLGFELPYRPPLKFRVSMVPCGGDGREYASLEWMGVANT